MEVKESLQAAMERWGCPTTMRFDNGTPWGTQRVLPSALGLWLVGLGIAPSYGRPARSTDNAVVERAHGVLNQWVDPNQCADFADCQKKLDWAVTMQREDYRPPKGQSRLQRYPELLTNPRTYETASDKDTWDVQLVAQYLTRFVFQRKVEKNGRFNLFANHYSVGRDYARQTLTITIDPQTNEWICQDETHTEIRRHPCRELDYEIISQLQLAQRRRKN